MYNQKKSNIKAPLYLQCSIFFRVPILSREKYKQSNNKRFKAILSPKLLSKFLSFYNGYFMYE